MYTIEREGPTLEQRIEELDQRARGLVRSLAERAATILVSNAPKDTGLLASKIGIVRELGPYAYGVGPLSELGMPDVTAPRGTIAEFLEWYRKTRAEERERARREREGQQRRLREEKRARRGQATTGMTRQRRWVKAVEDFVADERTAEGLSKAQAGRAADTLVDRLYRRMDRMDDAASKLQVPGKYTPRAIRNAYKRLSNHMTTYRKYLRLLSRVFDRVPSERKEEFGYYLKEEFGERYAWYLKILRRRKK